MSEASRQPELRPALGLPALVLYGLGVIIGAGIYVLVGTVAAEAAMATVLSFVLAGLLAALTGLCYAELAARFPEAAGAAVYVKEAFGSDRLSQATGIAVAFAVVVSAATIARGAAAYVQIFLDVPPPVVAAILAVFFTAVACLNVRESVGVAATMSAIEIGGLMLVLAIGSPALSEFGSRAGELVPADLEGWQGVLVGAFLAFFAFVGFENLANMAEETRNPRRALPLAIVLSIALSTALYGAVALVAVLAVPLDRLIEAPAPLLVVLSERGWAIESWFSAIALIAIANGVLIEILMLSRLLFGMARRGWLPGTLATVSAGTRTPVVATLTAGGAVAAFATLLDVQALASLTSLVTLLVFTLVDLSLWRLHRRGGQSAAIRVPRWVPPVGAAASVALIFASFL